MEKSLTSLCRFWRFSRLAGINIENLYLLFCVRTLDRDLIDQRRSLCLSDGWQCVRRWKPQSIFNFPYPTETFRADVEFSLFISLARLHCCKKISLFLQNSIIRRAQASSYNLFQTKVRSAVARYGNINSTRFVGICARARKKFDELRNENENENSRWKPASKRREKKEDKL